MAESSSICPLCSSASCQSIDSALQLHRCPNCALIHKSKDRRLSPNEEKEHYDFHENDPQDPDYRKFLSQLTEPLQKFIQPGQSGLDFGCGPGPTIKPMLEEKGFRVENWDPYYADEPEVLGSTYDFITATEVVEHFNDPKKSWAQMVNLLKPAGMLGIMTSLWEEGPEFENWHYFQEKSHVAFYHHRTLVYLANSWGLELLESTQKIALFRKKT